MSENQQFIMIEADILGRDDLSSTSKLVYGLLKLRIGENEKAWPGARKMAVTLGVSRPTILLATKELESTGLIEVERRGNGKLNYYRLKPVKKLDRFGAGIGKSGKEPLLEPVKKLDRKRSRTFTEIEQNRTIKEHTGENSISFDPEAGAFKGISQADRDRWADRFPGVDLDGELFKMADWLLDHSKQRPKNYRRFITNWLSRAEPALREEDDPDSIHYFDPVKEKWLEEHVDKPNRWGKYAVNNQEGAL